MLQAQKKTKLFEPGKKKAWHIYMSKSGINNDPLKVFQFEKKVIHVSGQDFGYMVTEKKYANFHLTLEFKWGEKKYPPRENEKRDGGVLYLVNFYNGDKIWPRSIEFQIQEGDCGDFWMTDSTTIVYKDTLTKADRWHREIKFLDAEKPNGNWNKVEVIVKNGKITHILNGKVVNEGSDPNVKEGNILIQSEGAELYYKNVVVEELDK
ncbi:MAG: DUF1080 domain-containing protein [Bacteroidota bacterium]|nr:DUF1080 domain-containing protein [Bacteroidota bacterium]